MNCNIEYSTNNGKAYAQVYLLNNPVYHVWVMHLNTEISIVYFNPDLKKSPFTIYSVYPDTDPKDAVNYLDRILKLKAFL